MPTPARLYHCFQRGNAKYSSPSEGKRRFSEGKSAFSEKCGVVGDESGRATAQRGPQRIGQRTLDQGLSVDEHVDGFRSDDRLRLAGDPERRADGEGGRAETVGCNRQLQHLVEARRRLPFDRLLDQLKIEIPLEELGQYADRPQEFVDRNIDVLAVARIEDDLLRVALDVADAQIVAKILRRRGHRLRETQAASAFHSGSVCESQCLPPGWNSVPPASCASGMVRRRLLSGTPGRTIRLAASKFLRDSSSVYAWRPGGSRIRRKAVPVEWQVMHRAWPGRFSVSSGWTLALNASKSSAGAAWA